MPITRKQLKEMGLGRLAASIQAHSRPSLLLRPDKRSAQPVNRLGGRPNLPKEIHWPIGDDEAPLSFIAQIDLATLPSIRGLPLPKTGALFFFYDAENQPWGYDPEETGGAQVIYSTAPLSDCAPRAFPRDLDDEARFRGVSLSVIPAISLNYLIGELRPTEEETQALRKLVQDEECVHRMGGHADQIQADDPCLQAQLVSNGLYCGDESGYREGKKLGLEGGAANWRLLLQVDSDERTGMSWGDAGRIYYMIRESDLRRRNFADGWLILQCY